MTRRVVLSAEARRDLGEILEYVAKDSPGNAVALIGRLETAAFELGERALRFPIVFAALQIRRRVAGSYNIYYFVREDRIDIYRILHGARNQQRLLFPDD